AAALLAWNPYNVADPGSQLSFTAVAAIFLVVPRLEAFLAGFPVPARLVTMLAVSAACSLATAPVLLLQFGTVPTYSVPANAFAEPVVGPLLGLGLVTAVLGAVPPQLESIYLLTGSDRPKIGRALERLRRRFGDDAVEHLSAAEAGGADAVASCNALGLFGGAGRLVIVENVDAWRADDAAAVAT